jgi:hypothetical protein
MNAGDDAWAQARAVQKAFGQTLLCGLIEKTGDSYAIHVSKPSVYPVVFVRGEERITSWGNNTAIKVATDEAHRLLGSKCSLDLLH